MVQNPFQVYRRIYPHMRRLGRTYALGFAALICTDAGVMASPWLLKESIDALERREPARRMYEFAALLLAAALVTGTFRFLWRRLLVTTSRELEYLLRNDYLLHLERLHPEYFHGMRTGDLMARATSDLNAVRESLSMGLIIGFDIFFMVSFSVIMMVAISPSLTLWVLPVMPVIGWLIRRVRSEIHRRYEATQEQQAAMSAFTQENFSGMRVIQACAQEEFQNETMRDLGLRAIDKGVHLARVQSLFAPLLTLLTGIAMALILWRGGRLVLAGAMSLGSFVAFSSYLGHLVWPISAASWVVSLYQRGVTSMGRLNEVLDIEPAIRNHGASSSRPGESGAVALDDVSFAFKGSKPVLHHLNLRVPSGAFIAIVGPTGAGKTALLNLIPRLYEATEGTVAVGGTAARDWNLEALRAEIGMVSQEPFLFSDTLQANIAFGKPDATLDEVEAAARVADLHDSIIEFPQGYATLIGERGVSLSGGQRQRLALARALLRQPHILLLDDALSNVDAGAEETILRHLRAAKGRWTCLFATHRFSAAQAMDFIVVMEEGRVVDVGPHLELLRRGGLYAKLYDRQRLGGAFETTTP